MNNFKYSSKQIKKIINKYNLPAVRMKGIRDNLIELKPLIEQFYDKYIFYLSYWKDDCAYHGWNWSEDDGTMEKMAIITDKITDNFLEIYALILMGLGETIDE